MTVRTVLFTSLTLGLTVIVGSFWLWSERTIKNFPSQNTGSIVFFGDSLVEGVGASAGQDMPSQLTRALGMPVLNYGVAGDTTIDGLARLDQALEEKPKLAIVLLGGNDFLRKIDRTTTANNLEAITNAFHNEGSVVLLLGVRSGIIGGGADELFEGVAEKTGAAYEEDVLKGVFGNPSLMSDAIHPNAMGYTKIVERLLPTIRELIGQ